MDNFLVREKGKEGHLDLFKFDIQQRYMYILEIYYTRIAMDIYFCLGKNKNVN